jgi:hypothetical protein
MWDPTFNVGHGCGWMWDTITGGEKRKGGELNHNLVE